MAHRSVVIDLSIGADDYLAHYRGEARDVIATTADGINVRFPSGRLQPFVSRDGIQGRFELVFDNNNRLIEVVRIS